MPRRNTLKTNLNNKSRISNKQVFFLLTFFFFLLFLLRIFLINNYAAFFYPDETRFSVIVTGINKSINQHSILPYLRSVFQIEARPGYGIIFGTVALLVNIYKSTVIAQVANAFVSIISCVLLFFIVNKFLNRTTAFITVYFFGLSLSSFTYIRHLFPYDLSLLFLLYCLFELVERKKYFLSGILLGISFSIYPGIYFYILPAIVAFFCLNRKQNNNRKFFLFGFGFLCLIFILEITSRILNKDSYLTTANNLSVTVNQGDFMPAMLFYIKYVFANDGYLGIIFSTIGVIFCYITLKNKNISKNEKLLLLFIVFSYIFLEITTFIGKKMVLYGRTIRIFYIANIILTASGISRILHLIYENYKSTNKKVYFVLVLLITAVSLFNFIPRYFTLLNLVYPDEFINANKSITHEINLKNISQVTTLKNNLSDNNPLTDVKKGNYYFVNTFLAYPFYGIKKIQCNVKLFAQHRHVQSEYLPYGYEGSTEEMRKNFESIPFDYQLIYCQ